MPTLLSRRGLLLGGPALLVLSRTSFADDLEGIGEYYDPKLLPPPEFKIDFPIKRVDLKKIKKRYRRQEVDYEGTERAGTVIVDPGHRFLYYIGEAGRATRFGVGVGRQGFQWSGDAVIGMKRRWPRWVPPAEMVDRDKKAALWVNGMPGGYDNPLGARAFYLYQNGVDTLYRIHGTNEPLSIGKAASSGCIRMLNEDIAFLYDKVEVGSPVTVLPAKGQT